MAFDEKAIVNAAFQTILDTTEDMIFVKNVDLVYIAASLPFARMVGKESVEEIIGHNDFEIFEDEHLARRYTDDDRKLLAEGEHLINYTEPLAEEDGHARYGSTSKYIIRDSEQRKLGILGITKDVTREFQVQQYHQKELQYLFSLPEDAYAAIYIDIDEWRVIDERRKTVNDIMIPWCDTIEGFIDTALSGISGDPEAEAFYRKLSKETMQSLYGSGNRDMSIEYYRRMNDETSRWVRDYAKFLIDPANAHLCVMFLIRDINEEKEAAQTLRRAAEIDELTGLSNRSSTMKGIRQYLVGEGREGYHALFMIDIDNFKAVNDTLGHREGDRFLIRIATAIRSCFRNTDIVGRIAGDEFFVFVKSVRAHAVIEERAGILLSAIDQVCAEYPQLKVSGSIGISCYPADGSSAEELYSRADEALYRAKGQGKDQYAFAKRD